MTQAVASKQQWRCTYGKPYYCWNVNRYLDPIMANRSSALADMDAAVVFSAQHYNFVIILSCRRQPHPIKVRRCPGGSPFFLQ
ncbi:hypothetical protein [Candidimonas nitroreducens]|jgi:hypothetical protein|uniref:hypothetical protein n=1 Tax=Candidimonas nitroreducens TaxID=683354 RepID=UPI0011785C18|nr:hypothetical protein [Candidimonas nitroreducens]